MSGTEAQKSHGYKVRGLLVGPNAILSYFVTFHVIVTALGVTITDFNVLFECI